MKVRDLKQYIRCVSKGEDNIELLGTNSEPFLTYMSGHRGEPLDSLLVSVASFASNAKEQLFYEFVQNAYDANADSLFFYANEKYLIVLNNGAPFYTDLDIHEPNRLGLSRNGQLYNFLNKGDSQKLNRKDQLGKYGQGSKLLYTLLADVNNSIETEVLLKDVIINERKGPYLISWDNMSQLDALLINDDNWIPAQADDVENNILFAKILMSYYPIAPGQATDFFSNEEAREVIHAFDELVDPKRNKSFLTRGTALIVPLGKGKYEAIVSPNNLENVSARLGGFASITADEEQNIGKSLKHIYVMKQEVEQHPVQSLFVDFIEQGKKFEYHFAFNPIFSDKNVVNFFKGLPILQTKYRFGFILDSQVLEVDDSRQRFTDIDKTCNQFKTALMYLVQKLKELKESDRTKFDYIYKSIVSSFPGNRNSEEEQKIWNTFYEVIRPFLNEYALTEDNAYVSFEEICEEEKEVDVKLKDLGIENLHWINPEISANFKKHFTKDLRVYGFTEMICDSNKEKLSEWIKAMNHEAYRLFQNNCLECIENEDNSIIDIKVFRSNKGNLFSYSELSSTLNLYYLSQQSEFLFPGQEYIVEPICEQYTIDDYKVLYQKIKSNIEKIRETAIGRNTACEILYRISINCEELVKEIQTAIPVLQNRKGNYLPFSELMAERPKSSILFDDFLVKGAIPEIVNNSDWLVDKMDDKESIWDWVCRHFEKLKEVDGWKDNPHNYIADIKQVYVNAGSPFAKHGLLHLWLNEQGQPVQEQCQDVEGFNRLTKEEFALIEENFSNYSFVPYEFHDELTSAPFYLNTLQVSDLLGSYSKIEFKILSLLAKITEHFFLSYRIIGTDNIYEVLPIGYGKNYCDNLDTNLRQALTDIGFYFIPLKVQSLIGQNRTAFKITRDDFILPIITKIKDKFLLFPLINQCTEDAKKEYIDSLPTFNIDSKLTQDDIKWKLIKFAASYHTEENKFKEKVFNLIRHDNECLPDSIKETSVIFNGHHYELYKLNINYEEENSQIDSFLKCLPSENDVEWFVDVFYGDKKEIIPLEDIYGYLHNKYLTVEQLRFCLDYSLNSEEHPQYKNLEIDEDEDLKAALDMIVLNNFSGFDEFFKITAFNSDRQVYADKSLLNEDELLPVELHEWLIQNEMYIPLFKKLRTAYNDPYVSIRKTIVENSESWDIPDFQDEHATKSTIDWLLNSKTLYVYNSNAYNTINRFIDKLPDQYAPMIFLKYTGATENTDENVDSINPIFVLDKYQNDSCFFSSASWTPIFREMLRDNQKIKRFFENSCVYLYEQIDLLLRHQLHKCPKLEVSLKANDGNYIEINSPVYKKWKQLEGSRGISIKTSKQAIGISFSMNKGKEEVFSIGIDNKDIGYIVNKLVVVKYPNEEKLSVIKMIEKNIKNMEFFQEPFILLQGLYVEQIETLEKIAEEKGTDISTIVNQSNQNGKPNETSDTNNGGNVKVEDEKIDSIRELAESFEAEELQELADNKDKILEVLRDLQDAEDDSQESQVRQTIGYIGELIFEQYLKAQHKDYKYAAIEGIGDYDFHNKTDKTYIDVKTTLYSLKEGTAPFYLHRSQNMFMQKHPNENYHIIRISLNDLNLQKSYERIRDIYGKDANPLENERLKNECQKIAEKYWKAAKIEEFDALSPEYSIRIEQKK